MPVKAKICGLTTPEAIEAAQDNGAAFLGFVFYEKSPRNIMPVRAAKLAPFAKIPKVAVTVDADDALLDSIIRSLKPQYIQLHGSETVERAIEIKEKYNIKLIKAQTHKAPITTPELYDYYLFDSAGGGTGKQFDYTGFTPPKGIEWFLSGGLDVFNLREAVAKTGARMVDVSSGVESTRGVKDINKIKEFLKTAHGL